MTLFKSSSDTTGAGGAGGGGEGGGGATAAEGTSAAGFVYREAKKCNGWPAISLVPAKDASLDAFRALGSGLGFGFCFDRPVGGKADLFRGGAAKHTKCMHARLWSKGEIG